MRCVRRICFYNNGVWMHNIWVWYRDLPLWLCRFYSNHRTVATRLHTYASTYVGRWTSVIRHSSGTSEYLETCSSINFLLCKELSSLGGSKCLESRGGCILEPQAVSFVESRVVCSIYCYTIDTTNHHRYCILLWESPLLEVHCSMLNLISPLVVARSFGIS